MSDDIKDLEYLPREELLMRLATKLERDRSRLEVLRVILDVVSKDARLQSTAPPEYQDAMKALPRMEKDILELRSIIHWLTKRRE